MSIQQTTTDEATAAAVAQREKAAGRRYRRQQSAFDILIIFLVVIVASVIYGLINPDTFRFNNAANIQNALQSIPINPGIPALGVGILMIAGEFDLSIGVNTIFSSVVMAQLFNNGNGLNVWLASLIGLAVGTGIGLLNGIITIRLKIPSFITTLGTSFFWAAAILFVHGAGGQTFFPDPTFTALTAGNIGGSSGVISSEFLWFIGLAIVCWALLQRNRIGNHIYAVGGDKQAALATGVRVERTKLIAFSLAGALAALGGILTASRINVIAPTSGTDLPLLAIAACVVGGLALNGGRGTILGIVLGSALLFWIQDVLLLTQTPGLYITAPVGALIIIAAAIYEWLRGRRS